MTQNRSNVKSSFIHREIIGFFPVPLVILDLAVVRVLNNQPTVAWLGGLHLCWVAYICVLIDWQKRSTGVYFSPAAAMVYRLSNTNKFWMLDVLLLTFGLCLCACSWLFPAFCSDLGPNHVYGLPMHKSYDKWFSTHLLQRILEMIQEQKGVKPLKDINSEARPGPNGWQWSG